MTWQWVAGANILTAGVYFAIAYLIGSALVRTRQLRSNRLGLATTAIFFTCAVHHGSHSVHMMLPSLGIEDDRALAMREAWHPQNAVWDFITAGVGVFYLSLRGNYDSVLRGAQMFEDLKVRERQALEINDNIVQGLTVAKYAMESGSDDRSREAIEDTLAKARQIITDLLGDSDSAGPRPGDLRRVKPAEPASEA